MYLVGIWREKSLAKRLRKDQAQGNYILLVKIIKFISFFNAVSINIPRGVGRRAFEKFILNANGRSKCLRLAEKISVNSKIMRGLDLPEKKIYY